MTALSFNNVTLGYGRTLAVVDVCAVVSAGSLTALVGPNGAGKSTLLKGITGEVRPRSGTIGRPDGHHNIAYLPQQAKVDTGTPMTVFDFVAMGLWRTIGAFDRVGADGRAIVHDALRVVGLPDLHQRQIGALSGGQMQRVLFARLLVQDAPVILLDEPFNSIDRRTVDVLTEVIDRWHGEGRTVLAVLHDLDHVREQFSHTLLIARELIAAGPTETVLSKENLFRARTISDAIDDNTIPFRRRAA
ncbi:MAG: metal ABC transporter ATP-binding protein [Pseudomonadota bacterium]